MVDINTSKEELDRLFNEEQIFASFNAEFCKDHIGEAPCNIFGLIKELINEIEDLKNRIK